MLANRSMPRSTVIPALTYPDVGEAVQWLCDVFGFTLRLRIANHRAQLNVGDGAVIVSEPYSGENAAAVSDESSAPRPAPTNSVVVRVPDVDAHHERTAQRGARILKPPASYPYGERQYTVEDVAGHYWTFSQSIADVAPEEWGGTGGQMS
jgi:uncharacterized glyoxalase superfamily protein PhnB